MSGHEDAEKDNIEKEVKEKEEKTTATPSVETYYDWKTAIAREYSRRNHESTAVENPPVFPLMCKTFEENEIVAIVDSVLTGQLTMSTSVRVFEKRFAEVVGAKYAVMVNSGSSAILLAMSVACNSLRKHHLRRNGEVLVSAVCWSTSVWPILQCGLKPVFVDADPITFQMNTADCRRKLTDRTVGVMLVHVLGGCAPMEDIMQICKENELVLIEDTCELLGSSYNGQTLGTFGDFGCFSFYFSHHITTGEGGLVVCGNVEDWDLLKCLRAHGWSRELSDGVDVEKRYSHVDPRFLFVNSGYNLRPLEICGVLGLKQINRLHQMNAVRRRNYDRLKEALHSHPKFARQLRVMESVKGCNAAWFGFAALLAKQYQHQRTQFIQYLTKHGIENRPIISGNFCRQPAIKTLAVNVKTAKMLGADEIGGRGFFIGVHRDEIPQENIAFLCDTMLNFPFESRHIVLVTGGSGTAGRGLRHFVEHVQHGERKTDLSAAEDDITDCIVKFVLSSDWIFLSSSDGDLRVKRDVLNIFQRHQPTHVIHLACQLMAGYKMVTKAAELWENNAAMNDNVLSVANEFGVKKLVSCLSSFAFPLDPPSFPIKEEYLHSGKVHPTYESYGMAKRALDVMTRSYRKQHGADFVTVNPTNLFGPCGKLHADGPLVESVAARALDAKAKGLPLTAYDSGKPRRQLLFSGDLARVLIWALEKYSDENTVNIVGEELSVAHVVKTVCEAIDFTGVVEFDASKPDGPLSRTVDGAKFNALWPSFKRTDFRVGIDICAHDWLKLRRASR